MSDRQGLIVSKKKPLEKGLLKNLLRATIIGLIIDRWSALTFLSCPATISILNTVLLNNVTANFFQDGENFHVFSPSRSLHGVSQHLQLLLWTMAPLPGESHQGELEDGEMGVMSRQDTMAGPVVPQCLQPASQVGPRGLVLPFVDQYLYEY